MKLKENVILEYFKQHWLRYVISCIFVSLITVLNVYLKGDFTSKIFYADGLFIGGALLVGYGLLILMNYFGTFDIFQFMFNRTLVNGRREQLYEYSVRKKAERKPRVIEFLDFIIVGFIFIIIAVLLLKI